MKTANLQAEETGKEQFLPSQPLEETNPLDTFTLDIKPPGLGDNQFLLFVAAALSNTLTWWVTVDRENCPQTEFELKVATTFRVNEKEMYPVRKTKEQQPATWEEN